MTRPGCRLLVVILLCSGFMQHAWGSREVRVGIYQNAPKVFIAEDDVPSGFFVDIVNAIGQAEGWQLQYVPCPWSQCLDLLEHGDLDIMVDVAHIPERDIRFDFGHQVVLSSWSVVYKRAGARVNSILDLDRKRIAVLSNSIQYVAMRQRAGEFDVSPVFVQTESFDEAFGMLREGQVDLVLTNRFYGGLNSERYGAEATSILIKPSSLKFAFPKQSAGDLLQITDSYITRFKQDPDSVYYQSMQRWLSPLDAERIPRWAKWTLISAAAALLLLVVLVATLRHRVKVHTALIDSERRHYYHLSMHDPLTDLPNRLCFFERLDEAIARADSREGKLYVFYIDLDQFRHINDSVGHVIGDHVLQLVAQRLDQMVRGKGLIARLSGDEFGVLCESCADRDVAAGMARQLLDVFNSPLVDREQQFYLSASIGISGYPQDGCNAQEIMKHADTALFSAKDRGRNTFEFYDQGMSDHSLQRVSLESDLRVALDQLQFVVYYQPQIELDSSNIVGMEALTRWIHPEKGLISPTEFIPMAEETGVIVALGEWILRTACEQAMAWQHEGILLEKIAVNVSPQQLLDEAFYHRVLGIIEETGCRPEYIELEITESAMLNYTDESLAILERLIALGFGIAIDDFGTGHSSLSRLKYLPVTTLKIDISFIRGLPGDHSDAALTRAIIALGEGLGLRVLAEGIEREEQRDFLRGAGCDQGQGYLYSPPLTADDVSKMLTQKHASQ